MLPSLLCSVSVVYFQRETGLRGNARRVMDGRVVSGKGVVVVDEAGIDAARRRELLLGWETLLICSCCSC